MDIISRDKCVVTGSKNLEEIYRFIDFPVHQGTTNAPFEEDLRMDLIFDICKESGMIQVRNLVPEPVLYNQEHSRSIGGTWQRHHKKFADFLRKYEPCKVFEIGGGIGFLETFYNNGKYTPVPWIILEPNAEPIEGCHAEYERGFFNESYSIKSEYDTLVFSHLFEHIYKPYEFMSHLSAEIAIGKKMVFSVPDMEAMLNNHQTNTLNFEHCYYAAEPYVDYMLTKNGFEILEKKKYEGHSIFYSAERRKTVSKDYQLKYLYEKNLKVFQKFIDDYKAFVNSVNEKLVTEKPEYVFLFGAHLFSQFLLGFGLHEKNIKAILDNDKAKHGRRLQGSNLICKSPEVLRGIKAPVVIIRAGTYQEEIKKGLFAVNKNVIILE